LAKAVYKETELMIVYVNAKGLPVEMLEQRQNFRHHQKFIQKNYDLIARWYQVEKLGWPMIAARLNQCLPGGGISPTLLQTTLSHLRRPTQPSPVSVETKSEVVQEPSEPEVLNWQDVPEVQALEDHIRHQTEIIHLQQTRTLEATSRWARLEELVAQLVPMIRDAQQCAEQLPRNSAAANHVRDRLNELEVVLSSLQES
jgi:hypothetical protein